MESRLPFAEVYPDLLHRFELLLQNRESFSLCLCSGASSFSRLFLEHGICAFEGIPFSQLFNSNDVFWHEGNQVLKIDTVREMIRFSAFSNQKLAHSYLVIERLDRLHSIAENGLLKLLEEPPGKTVVLCTAESFEALLPTVQSRVIRMDLPFRPSVIPDAGKWPAEVRWLLQAHPWSFLGGMGAEAFSTTCASFRDMQLAELFSRYSEQVGTGEESLQLDLCALFLVERLVLQLIRLHSQTQPSGASQLFAWLASLLAQFEIHVLPVGRKMGSAFFLRFFRGLFRVLRPMVLDLFLHAFSREWEGLAYPLLNKEWVLHRPAWQAGRMAALLRFLQKVESRDPFLFSAELTFCVWLNSLSALADKGEKMVNQGE
ncbi:MAG TPA: hypothetical protein P5560_08445 [Thermotogota bacterium]|nr:hypothetical protein [Thermotogota bacterium]